MSGRKKNMSRLRKTKAFAVKLKDSQKLEHSSSGGAFTAISDVFLSCGGVVVSYMVPPR